MRDGEVVFGTTISKSNADGLGGKTTIDEYKHRDSKVLVFGDSFTHWNQMGVTWPDLLEEQLSVRLGTPVGVLNYARGTYGVIQMLELASEMAQEHNPDLIILAAVYDDFTRARWWRKEIEWKGYKRWMLSSRKDSFLDYRVTVDTTVVDERATREWYERMLVGRATESDRAILASVNRQFIVQRWVVFEVR